jgi:hypothetical protein
MEIAIFRAFEWHWVEQININYKAKGETLKESVEETLSEA